MSLTAIGYLLVYFTGIFRCLAGKPVYGLYAYLFAFYMHAPSRWWGSALPDLRWAFLAAVLTLVSIFIYHKGRSNWLSRIENKLFLTFVIWVWLQSSWAINPAQHKEFAVMATKFLLLMYLIQATIRTEKELMTFFVVNLLGTAYFGWLGYTTHTSGRFENVGTPGIDDGNLLSTHMGPVLIAGSYLLLCQLGKVRFLLVPPIVLTLNAILLTQSRGGLLALFVAGVSSVFFVPKRVKKLYSTFAVLAVFAFSLLIGPELLERLQAISDVEAVEDTDKSAYSRLVIIEAQLEMFKLNPLGGQGSRGTLTLSPDYIPEEFMTKTQGGTKRGSHNLIMSLLVDHGIIGASLYLMIFASLIWKAVKNRRRLIESNSNFATLYIGGCLSLICYHVAGLFSNSMRLEVDIWFYATMAMTYSWFIDYENGDRSRSITSAEEKSEVAHA